MRWTPGGTSPARWRFCFKAFPAFMVWQAGAPNPTMAVGIPDKLIAREEKLKSAAAECQDAEDDLIEDEETP